MSENTVKALEPLAASVTAPASSVAVHGRSAGALAYSEAQAAKPAQARPSDKGAELNRNRLIIEPTDGHRFIYKVLDGETGEIIRQFPREDVLRMSERPDYDPGQVFATDI